MKRLVLLILLSLVGQLSMGQTKAFFNKFKHEKNAEYYHLPGFLFNLIPIVKKDTDSAEDTKEMAKMMRKIKSIRTLELNKCSERTKSRFLNAAQELNTKGYATLLKHQAGKEVSLIMYKLKQNTIKELLIVDVDKDECSAVLIKGKFKAEQISQLCSEDNNLIGVKKKTQKKM